jgi:cysteine-rich repeat protein
MANYTTFLKRAQVSIEFIAMVSFIMFIFIGLLIVFNSRMNDAIKEKDKVQVENVKEQLYGQFYNAAKAESGYSNVFIMSALIEGEPFDLVIEKSISLVVKYKDINYVYSLPENVSGIIHMAFSSERPVYVFTIRKIGDKIIITTDCGNGRSEPSLDEECDDGNTNNNDDCKIDCSLNFCGDNYVNLYLNKEQCDPPNPGNGCDALCQSEAGYVCCGSICYPSTVCGDSIFDSISEECDDGCKIGIPGCDSADDGDGCSATCTIEPDYICDNVCGGESTCYNHCGDGTLDTDLAEECDPPDVGNGCDGMCQIEPPPGNFCILDITLNCILI